MNVLIVDDHPVIAHGVMKMLTDILGSPRLLHVLDGKSAKKSIKKDHFDLAIVDVYLPKSDTHALLHQLLHIAPHLKVLVYSSCNPEIYAPLYKTAGALGYVHKSSTFAEFSIAVKRILSGREYFPAISEATTGKQDEVKENPFSNLSKREMEVFLHLVKGRSVKEICALTQLEPSTIGTQKARIYQKLGVQNTVDLFRLAQAYGEF